MKGRYFVIAGILLLLFFAAAWIGYTANAGSSPERTVALAERELKRLDLNADDLMIVHSLDQGEYRMVWFLEDGENCLPMEFSIRQNGSLKFRHLHQPIDRGRDVYALDWINMKGFFINNPDCVTLRITDANDNVTNVSVSGIPFVYWLDITPSQYSDFTYEFLDKDGNQIY